MLLLLQRCAITRGMLIERHLWSAVLGLAIEDLADSRTSAHDLYNTRLWFASDNYEPASFLWICDQLEIDAVTVRRQVFKGSPSGVR